MAYALGRSAVRDVIISIITLAKLRSYIKRNGVCANRFRNTSTAKFNGQYFGTAKPHHLIDQ